MAVGLHAVNKSAIQPGEAALVLGCGPIGLAVIAALRHRGVEHIVAADYSPKRRELATTMGAHQTVDPARGITVRRTVKPAVVFEAIGVPGIINDVMRRAPMGTRLVVAGVCMEPDPIMPLFGIGKEINVQFVLGYDADRVRRIPARDRRGRDRRRAADHRRGRPRRRRRRIRRPRQPRHTLQNSGNTLARP